METRSENKRISFAHIPSTIDMPDLLDLQLQSFEEFLQLKTPPSKRLNQGLQAVFLANFPILDNKEFYRLDFVEYYVEKSKYLLKTAKKMFSIILHR